MYKKKVAVMECVTETCVLNLKHVNKNSSFPQDLFARKNAQCSNGLVLNMFLKKDDCPRLLIKGDSLETSPWRFVPYFLSCIKNKGNTFA